MDSTYGAALQRARTASNSVTLMSPETPGAFDALEHLLYSLSKSLLGEVVVGDWAERRASFSSALPRIVRLELAVSYGTLSSTQVHIHHNAEFDTLRDNMPVATSVASGQRVTKCPVRVQGCGSCSLAHAPAPNSERISCLQRKPSTIKTYFRKSCLFTVRTNKDRYDPLPEVTARVCPTEYHSNASYQSNALSPQREHQLLHGFSTSRALNSTLRPHNMKSECSRVSATKELVISSCMLYVGVQYHSSVLHILFLTKSVIKVCFIRNKYTQIVLLTIDLRSRNCRAWREGAPAARPR